jgi:hypothetical protein
MVTNENGNRSCVKPLTTAPAANNVVRYLDCTYSEINFFRERDWLALLVSDNGNVFARL